VSLRTTLRAAARKNRVLYAAASRVLRVVRRRRAERVGGPLGLYAAQLPAKRNRLVIVLTDAKVKAKVQPYLREFRRDRVHVLSVAQAPQWQEARVAFEHHALGALPDMNRLLATLGPVDVLVDLLPGPADEYVRRWKTLFFHLNPGGAYAIDRRLVQGPSAAELLAWFKRIGDLTGRDPESNRSEDAEATAAILLTPQLVLVTKRHRHYLKLRDANVEQVLAAREPQMKVTALRTLPAGELESRAEVVSHEAAVPIPWLPKTMPYPPMHLRHYKGRVAFLGSSLVHTEASILPDSFRWHLEPNPRNPKIRSATPEFARIVKTAAPSNILEGDYFHMDPNGVGHFGHFLTESIGRLWAWDEAKQRFPDLKAIYRIRDPAKAGTRFERRLMMAYGIAAEDIVPVERPVYLTSLVSATTMWHNAVPHYVHPALSEVWERISRNLIDPDAPTYERVFVSRTGQWWRRVCRNIADVEKFFESHGFTIVYPEALDLATQAAIFANTPVIAGFGGSAMFNVMHARHLKTFILLGHEAYTARNEHLYTSLIGGPVHYFWSPPDIAHPVDGWKQAAFDSDWEFDFARNRKPLEELIASL
jgi:capsular polysaccharide biosynthesis protein